MRAGASFEGDWSLAANACCKSFKSRFLARVTFYYDPIFRRSSILLYEKIKHISVYLIITISRRSKIAPKNPAIVITVSVLISGLCTSRSLRPIQDI